MRRWCADMLMCWYADENFRKRKFIWAKLNKTLAYQHISISAHQFIINLKKGWQPQLPCSCRALGGTRTHSIILMGLFIFGLWFRQSPLPIRLQEQPVFRLKIWDSVSTETLALPLSYHCGLMWKCEDVKMWRWKFSQAKILFLSEAQK